MKNNYTKHLLGHSVVYGAGEILNKAFGFILIPIYTRYLSTETYGILQILLITASLVSIALQMGLGSAIFKSILHSENINKDKAYSTALYFLIIVSILITLVILPFSEQISILTVGLPEYSFVIKLIFASIILKNLSIIPLAKLRIQDKSVLFSTINVSRFFMQLLLTVFFVVGLKQGIEGIILAELITVSIFAIVFLKIILENLKFTFSAKELKSMLAFGLPLVPAALAMFILNMADRYFLRYYSTLDQVGLYSLAYRCGMIMAIIVGAFQQAWGVVMFKIANEPDAKSIYQKNFTYFLILLSFIGLGLSIFAEELLILIATGPYIASYKIIPIITLTYVFYGIYYYTAVGLNLKKKTIYQPVVVGSSALLNLILNYLLIPAMGTMGAALATLISFIVMAVLATYVSLHFYNIEYEYRRITHLALIAGGIFSLGFFVNFGNFTLGLFYKLCLLISVPFILYKAGIIGKNEIGKLKKILKEHTPQNLRS